MSDLMSATSVVTGFIPVMVVSNLISLYVKYTDLWELKKSQGIVLGKCHDFAVDAAFRRWDKKIQKCDDTDEELAIECVGLFWDGLDKGISLEDIMDYVHEEYWRPIWEAEEEDW